MNATKLRWWVIFNTLLVGAYLLYYKGAFTFLSHADETKISFVTLSVFALITVFIGHLTINQGKPARDRQQDLRYINACWFASEMLMGLGLVGTVLGIILMFSANSAALDPSNFEAMKTSIAAMSSGLTTAFVTTLTGISTSMLVKLQLINYEVDLE